MNNPKLLALFLIAASAPLNASASKKFFNYCLESPKFVWRASYTRGFYEQIQERRDKYFFSIKLRDKLLLNAIGFLDATTRQHEDVSLQVRLDSERRGAKCCEIVATASAESRFWFAKEKHLSLTNRSDEDERRLAHYCWKLGEETNFYRDSIKKYHNLLSENRLPEGSFKNIAKAIKHLTFMANSSLIQEFYSKLKSFFDEQQDLDFDMVKYFGSKNYNFFGTDDDEVGASTLYYDYNLCLLDLEKVLKCLKAEIQKYEAITNKSAHDFKHLGECYYLLKLYSGSNSDLESLLKSSIKNYAEAAKRYVLLARDKGVADFKRGCACQKAASCCTSIEKTRRVLRKITGTTSPSLLADGCLIASAMLIFGCPVFVYKMLKKRSASKKTSPSA